MLILCCNRCDCASQQIVTMMKSIKRTKSKQVSKKLSNNRFIIVNSVLSRTWARREIFNSDVGLSHMCRTRAKGRGTIPLPGLSCVINSLLYLLRYLRVTNLRPSQNVYSWTEFDCKGRRRYTYIENGKNTRRNRLSSVSKWCVAGTRFID